MRLCSDMNLSTNILSKDKYFTLGLIELLGGEFIEKFFLIIDLDSINLSGPDWIYFSNKNIVAFTSSDLAFYKLLALHKSDLFEKITVLDKKSNSKNILNFFLNKEIQGGYHTKSRLSLREKQMLIMFSRGASNQKIAEEFGLKLKTIYTHRRNLMIKLGCRNRITFQNLFCNNKCFFK